MFKILSIDGGGIRGLIPAIIIDEFEKRIGQSIWQYFDLITGTSTGGIITCALTKPNPLKAEEVVELYSRNGSTIFNSSWGALGKLWNAQYSGDGIDRTLSTIFGGTSLSSTSPHILVTAYDPVLNAPHFFRTLSARVDLARDFPLREVARATSAAPTYFPPAKVRSLAGKDFTLLDGGLFANNPTLCAIADACARYHKTLDELMVVSLGTGGSRDSIRWNSIENAGIISWIIPLLSMMFAGSSTACDWQVRQLVKNYVRLDVPAGIDTGEMDDVSRKNITLLTALAQCIILDNSDRIDRIIYGLDA